MDDRVALDSEDRRLLEEALASCDLTENERDVFSRWLAGSRPLTPRMRGWAESAREEHDRSRRDRDLLGLVIGNARLTPEEDSAFCSMQAQVEKRVRGTLTEPQRAWVTQAACRLCLEPDEAPLNLHSAGRVKEGPPRKERLLPWEQPGYVKPTRPPGRSY